MSWYAEGFYELCNFGVSGIFWHVCSRRDIFYSWHSPVDYTSNLFQKRLSPQGSIKYFFWYQDISGTKMFCLARLREAGSLPRRDVDNSNRLGVSAAKPGKASQSWGDWQRWNSRGKLRVNFLTWCWNLFIEWPKRVKTWPFPNPNNCYSVASSGAKFEVWTT